MLTAIDSKSQIAIEFSYRYHEQRPDQWIFYVHAGSKSRFMHDYRNIAIAVKIPGYEKPLADVYSLIRSWLLDAGNGAWLLIIDNADDRGVFFDEELGVSTPLKPQDDRPLHCYIPPSAHGKVLITSRNHTGAEIAGGYHHVLSVGLFEQDTALSLLQLKLPRSAGDSHAKELATTLDYVPLAINQAAAYIYRTGISIENYLSVFNASEESQVELLSKKYYDIYQNSNSARAITTSWSLSFEHIRMISSLAADALGMMAMMDRQAISEDLIFKEDVSEIHRSEAIAILVEYALVRRDQCAEKQYSMHRLVQVCTRAHLQADQLLKAYVGGAICSVFSKFANRHDPMSWSLANNLVPHVQTVIGYTVEEPALESWLALMEKSGTLELMLGNHAVAKVLYSQTLTEHKKIHGPCGLPTLLMARKLARCHFRLQEYQEAHDIVREALHVLTQQSNQDPDQEILTLQFRILEKRLSQGAIYPDDFEDFLYRVIHLAEEGFGRDTEQFVSMLYLWGDICALYGHWDESEEWYERAMHSKEEHLGLDHTATHHANQLAEAEHMYRRCLEGAERRLGQAQFDTLRIVRILARFYFEQSRYDESRVLYERALAGEREQRRPSNVRILKVTHNLRVVSGCQGRLEEAQALLEEPAKGSGGLLDRAYPATLEYTGEEPSIFIERVDRDDWDDFDADPWNPNNILAAQATEPELEGRT